VTYWFGFVPVLDEVLFAHVEDRLDRAFDGAAWLRRRFPGGRTAEVRAVVHDAAVVEAGATGVVGGSRKRVFAEVRIPAVWFGPQAGGSLGFRLMGAALLGLDAIGAAYDLGPCPLHPPGRKLRRPLLPSLAEAGKGFEPAVGRLVAGLPADRLLLLAGSETAADRRWQRTVAQRLAAAPMPHDDEEEVSAWTAPRPV